MAQTLEALLAGLTVRADNVLAAPAGHPLPTAQPSPWNLPNAITLAGFAAGVHWIAGGPWWMALVSIAADEIDGRVARATGQASELGSLFDWSSDVALTGLVLHRLGRDWAIPPVLVGQVALRGRGWRPPVGSARAGLMLYALWTDWREGRT